MQDAGRLEDRRRDFGGRRMLGADLVLIESTDRCVLESLGRASRALVGETEHVLAAVGGLETQRLGLHPAAFLRRM